MKLTVPASPPAQQNGITVQFRSQHPDPGETAAGGFVIPPMTPVFKTNVAGNPARKKRVRYTQDTNLNEYQAAHAQFCNVTDAAAAAAAGAAAGAAGATYYTYENFLGVSTDGLPDGASAKRFPGQATHFTATTRGLVTVMCCWENVKQLRIGDPVMVTLADTNGAHTWNGIGLSERAGNGPFTLKHSTDNARTIGYVVSRPDGVKDRANECTIMLR